MARGSGTKRRSRLCVSTWLVLSIAFLACTVVDSITPYEVWAWSEDERLLAEARERILVVRRGGVSLDFSAGNAGKAVAIEQVTHAFKFGSNAFYYNNTYAGGPFNATLNGTYTSHFNRLFNYATLPFYMKAYEARQEKLKEMSAMLQAENIAVKGHPIIWQIANQIPDEVEFSTNSTYRKEWTEQHIENVLLNHTDIRVWDLVNEMTHVKNLLLGSTAVETWENALAKARSVRGDCTFIANEYGTIQPGDAATSGNDAEVFYDFVERVVADGHSPDAIGFQGHEWMTAWVPMKDIVDTFDSFGRFRIPIHITEFDPGSKEYYGGSRSIRRGPMSEASQAELATKAYTTFFSHPAVDAITWWAFMEDPWWRPELGDYMMTADGRVLPVYHALYDLIHVQWNSSMTVTLDAVGRCDFTGFYGNYTATVAGSPPIPFAIVDTRPPSGRPWTTGDVV
ncbi:MAG: endo-1,4-beta-xylanase [Candidatus Lokiarchaeota archaeon]|nr:endo-1,4-beta-xylanase [Candidatus Lokiarchaeota archaeon]